MDIRIEDLAISAIAPLFCRESENQVLPIIREFNSWQPPIQTEADALFFLNKVISGRVEQHISYLLKEADPFFAKILDSVNHLIRKGGYKKTHYLGRKYIVHSSCNKLNSKTIDTDDFQNLPFSLFKNRKTILSDILTYLENETNFIPAIPLNSLIVRLRNLNISNFKPQTSTNEVIAAFDADELVNFGLNFTIEKLESSYFSKGKLTGVETDYFKKTLETIANDLRDGGLTRGLYDYFAHQMHGLEKQTYQEKYHNMLEYLVKVMKNTIRERMAEGDV